MADRGPTRNPLTLITEDHVKAALKADKGDKAHLTSFTTSDCVEKGDNMATVVTRLQVHFQQPGQQNQQEGQQKQQEGQQNQQEGQQNQQQVSYIVKINPCRESGMPEDFNHMIFDKEIDFYTNIVLDVNSMLNSVGQEAIRVPRFIYSCLEPMHELIFLEDLRARGFEMRDKYKGQDEAHARLVMQELARLHASSYLLQMKLPSRDLTDKYLSLNKDWLNVTGQEKMKVTKMFTGSYDNTVVMLKKIPGYEKVAAWIEDNAQKSIDIIQKQIKRVPPFEVLCHGDCWNNNMLFRYHNDGTPAEVILLDHQVSRVASPCTDLTNFLFNNLPSEVRRQNLDSLLTCYYRTFSSVMEAAGADTPFSESELRQEFRDKMQYGLMFSLLIFPFMVAKNPEAGPGPEDILCEDSQDKLKAWREKNLKEEMLLKNPLVRSRFLDTLDDMVEAGAVIIQ